MPRDGYYEVSGYLELRRRRGGGATSGVVDDRISASLDDGYSRIGTFNDTGSAVIVGEVVGEDMDIWARYPSMDIPQGATIDVAYIAVTPDLGQAGGANTKSNIYMNDSDDAVAPTDRAEHVALSRTTAFTAWDDEDVVVDVEENSPSIVDAVKEVVDRGSWVSGNAMMVLWDDDGSPVTTYMRFYSYDDTPAKSIKLHIEWSS